MRMTGSAARLAVAVLIGLGPAGCSVAPSLAPPSPTGPPPGSAVPASDARSPTTAATATPPASTLIGWRQLPPQQELKDAQFNSVAFVGDRYLGLGCATTTELGCVQPAIWESIDGLTWRTGAPVFLAPDASGGTVVAAVVSRLGTIAAGYVREENGKLHASIWLRGSDGWAQITPQAESDAAITSLLATDGRVIAIGSGAFTHFSGFKAWWSADGTTWQAVPPPRDDPGGYPIELLAADGTLLAWGSSCSDVCPVLPAAWWATVDGTSWQSVDAPRGLGGASITAIGRTEGGFVAFGSLGPVDQPQVPGSWVANETAAEWVPVEPPPQPDATSIRHHLLVGHGSVAAGYAPPGPGREQLRGLVWLRGPGESSWRTPVELPDLEVFALFQHPEQLNRIIVMGRTFEGLQERIVTWTGLVEWAP